jgi:hypothetical protein
MTAFETIRQFLRDNPMKVYCDDCLSSLLKIRPRQAVQQKTTVLGKTYPFRRASGRCAHCNKIKLAIGFPIGVEHNDLPAKTSIAHVEQPQQSVTDLPIFSEDEVKKVLQLWLTAQGWSVEIAWAKNRGIDIHARRNQERWIIEVKGGGSLNAMRVNYFLGILGETLQRMDDPKAAYSIALPDFKQFRNLWMRLPTLAKQRTQITALFVRQDGSVEKIN